MIDARRSAARAIGANSRASATSVLRRWITSGRPSSCSTSAHVVILAW
jgi:hypothetical protein